MIVIGLNGPAGSGKDAIAAYLGQQYSTVHMEIKELLFEAAIRISGMSRAVWFAMYNDREYKESPNPYLMVNGKNVTMREFMIHVSEKVMKPMFGNDVFGKALVQKLKKVPTQDNNGHPTVVVLSDGGFVDEGVPVIDHVEAENYFLIRLHRIDEKGIEFGFGEDSRRYIYASEFPEDKQPWELDVYNHPDKMKDCAEGIMDYVFFKLGDEA